MIPSIAVVLWHILVPTLNRRASKTEKIKKLQLQFKMCKAYFMMTVLKKISLCHFLNRKNKQTNKKPNSDYKGGLLKVKGSLKGNKAIQSKTGN